MITKVQADRSGQDWIQAWNSDDRDRILPHSSEDFVIPRISPWSWASERITGRIALQDLTPNSHQARRGV